MKYNTSILIGRFQPFHNGHKHLVFSALNLSEKIIICCCSANSYLTKKNPWSYLERRTLIESSLEKNILDRTIIIPVSDHELDQDWEKEIIQKVKNISGDKAVLVGHFKDQSSYYLRQYFQCWDKKLFDNFEKIDATYIRSLVFGEFEKQYIKDNLKNLISAKVLEYILKSEYKKKVAKVLLALPVDREFSYKIGVKQVYLGSIVKVDFRKRKEIGIVSDISEKYDKNIEYKEIEHVYNIPCISSNLIDFIKKFSYYNIAFLGKVVKMILLSAKNIEYKAELLNHELSKDHKKVILSDIQNKVVNKIIEYGIYRYTAHLIKGATGSGKTEIYLDLAQRIINLGKQVVILLPEILLTTQLFERFENRLLNAHIARWNSSLSFKKRSTIWHNLLSGRINVIVGARSALLLPFLNLGLIIIDEEHDYSFKQEEGIIYNARDMAVLKAKIEKIPVLLLSATPSIESYYNTIVNKYVLHEISSRYTGVSFPEVKVIPKGKETISKVLESEIQSCIDKKKISMLFLNKRGYFTITLCSDCGEKFSCPNCEFWLVEHKKLGKMLCHYCGFIQEKFHVCYKCNSDKKLVAIRPGVEKVEEILKDKFPGVRVITLTSDTIDNFKKAKSIISSIENKEFDIIVGTQMLAKGLNFPDLHLVGVIDAETALSGYDLKVLERTFQLLYQVAGRAGREKTKGVVFIQTLFPKSKLLNYIVNWDYDGFIKAEMISRKESNMPPFFQIVMLRGSSLREEKISAFMRHIVKKISFKGVEVLGPAPAPLYKLKNRYRWRIILRCKKEAAIQRYIKSLLSSINIPKSILLKVDVDPYSFS